MWEALYIKDFTDSINKEFSSFFTDFFHTKSNQFPERIFPLKSEVVISAYKTETAAWLVCYRTYQNFGKGLLQDRQMVTLINYC